MARYFQSQLVDPMSAYVSPPWEIMAGALGQKQKLQDQYKGQVSLLDKPFGNLTNDTDLAVASKKIVEDKLANLRNLDYNDPQSKDQIYNTIQEVRNMYSPQGEIGVIQNKLDQYEGIMKNYDKIEEKDPSKATFLKSQLLYEAQAPERAIQKDANGRLINTTVTAPQNFEWKDPNATASEYLKDVAYNTLKLNGSWSGTPAEAVLMYQSGTLDRLTTKQINDALIPRILADKDLLNSTKALNFNESKDINQAQQEEQFVTGFDDKGNAIFNTDTILGKVMTGLQQSAYERIKPKEDFITDQDKLNQKQYDREHPFVMLEKEIEATNYASTVDSADKISTKQNETGNLQQQEWVKLMRTNPSIWKNPDGTTKFGVNSDGSNLEQLANAMFRTGSFENFMRVNGDSFVKKDINGNVIQDDGAKLRSFIQEQKTLNVLDQEASETAKKQAIVGARGVSDINISLYDPQGNPTGKSKVIPATDAAELISYYKEVSTSPSTYGHALDKPKMTPGSPEQVKANQIAMKNGYKNSDEMYKDINTVPINSEYYAKAGASYTKAKDDYLKNNAKTRQVETFASNTMPILMPDPEHPGQYILDDKKTKLLSTAVSTGFKGSDYDDVVTNIPKDTDKDGNVISYYTVGEQKTIAAKERADAGLTGDLPVGQMFYSGMPGSDGSPVMTINIGGKEVPINTNRIIVTDESGKKTPLGQLNDTPTTQVNSFMTTVYKSGVKNYPVEIAPGVNAIIQPGSGGTYWVNDHSTKITIPGVKDPLTGPEAFNYLVYLQKIGKL